MPSSKLMLFLAAVCIALNLSAAASAMAVTGTQDIRVAVLPFEINAGDDLQYLKDGLPDLLRDRLREAGFDVVGKADIESFIQERGITTLDLTSARNLAVLTKSNFAVYGSFSQIGDSLSIDARLVDAFGLQPARPLHVTRDGLINLLPAVDDLVQSMRADLLREQRISSIDVEGTHVLDKEVVLMRLGLQVGDLYDAKVLNKELRSVYDLGYFDDVKVSTEDEDKGKKVIFTVVEKPRIQAIGVKGADAIGDDEILDLVTTKKGAVLNPRVLAKDIKTIREMYRTKGYYNAKVTHEIEGEGSGQARLNFVIDEGKKLYIEKITIEGAQQLDPDEIKDELALKEYGIMSWFSSSGVLREDYLERDASAIQAYYGNRGFFKAKVGQPEVDVREDGIYITFRVFEGDRYRMGDVSFKGDIVGNDSELRNIIGADDLHAKNEFFDRSVVQKDLSALTDYYSTNGYAYADIGLDIDGDEDNKVVNLTYAISKHQKVHIRRIQVEGNTKTRDNVIMRELLLADGDQFDGQKLQRSTERLNKLGFFETAEIEPVPTGDPSEMDLRVRVKDQATGSISGGVGFSSYDGAFIKASLAEAYMFGRGIYASLVGQIGGKSSSLDATLYNPHLNDSKLGFGGDVYLRRNEYTDYSKDSKGGDIRMTYPLGEYTTLGWGYTLEFYRLYDIDEDDASDEILDDAGNNVSSMLHFSVIRDTLNDLFNPTKGSRNALYLYYGGGPLGGTDDFVKYVGQSGWFMPVLGDLVLHLKGSAGFIHDNFGGGDIPTDQRFKLGGMSTVRGYTPDTIAPLEDGTDHRMGGDKFVTGTAELLFPLSKEYGLVGLGFFDAGNAWKEDESFFEQVDRVKSAPSFGLYKSVGVGIRWKSPMGPLRLEYGYGMDDLYESSNHRVSFSMGRMF